MEKTTLTPLIFLKGFIFKVVKESVDFNINFNPISKEFLKAYINESVFLVLRVNSILNRSITVKKWFFKNHF